MNKVALGLIAGLGVFLAVVIGLFFLTSDADLGSKPQQFTDLGGNFTLTSKDGDVSLADYQGKVVVMYFGFLTCPEVCPQSMTVISSALSRLNDQQLEQSQAVSGSGVH